MTRIGVVLSEPQQPEIRSVQRVHKQFLSVLENNFLVSYVNLKKTQKMDAFRKFVRSSDAVVCFNPLVARRDSTWQIPFLFIALGSLPTGAIWYLHTLKFMSNIDVFLHSCSSDGHIIKRIFPKKEIGSYFLPFGIDTAVFQPRTADEIRTVKTSIGIAEQSPLFVYAGRLNPHKNVIGLIRIHAAVVRERPDAMLCIAGSEDHLGTSSGYLQLIKRHVAEYGLTGNIRFAGNLNDNELAALYSGAFAFVTCTTNPDENFGYAPVEAMSCGTPVIGTAWGGLKDTVIPGRTGYLMPTSFKENTVSFSWEKGAEFILSLLANPGTRDQMGYASVRHATERYSLVVFEKNLCTAVRATLDRRDHIETVISGSKFELDPVVYDYLALIEYAYTKGIPFTPENNFWEHTRYRSLFLAPYASQEIPYDE